MELWDHSFTLALIGGIVIGISVTMMLLFKGRVTGISSIIYGIMAPMEKEWYWRVSFVAGLIAGGFLLKVFYPSTFVIETDRQSVHLIIAGLLVGYGTLLGNGCTSGHGVCGISRLSVRSITATLVFILFGILATYLMRIIIVGGTSWL